MNSQYPFFSVVIPVYNRRHEIEKALESVNGQLYSAFEIIVIDDASTDGTAEWLQKLQHEKLRVLSNTKTKGACGARNTGIEAAKGEWIAFLDSDDWWDVEKLQVIAEHIISHPSYSVFYSACYYVGKKGDLNPIPTPGITGNITEYLGRMNPVRGFSGIVVKKTTLELAGCFDESLPARQDIDLYFRLATHSHFFFIPDLLAYVNFGNDDKISFNSYKRLMGWLMVYRKHKAAMKFADRLYQQKRITNFAWRVKRFDVVVAFLPGAFASFAGDLFKRSKTVLSTE